MSRAGGRERLAVATRLALAEEFFSRRDAPLVRDGGDPKDLFGFATAPVPAL